MEPQGNLTSNSSKDWGQCWFDVMVIKKGWCNRKESNLCLPMAGDKSIIVIYKPYLYKYFIFFLCGAVKHVGSLNHWSDSMFGLLCVSATCIVILWLNRWCNAPPRGREVTVHLDTARWVTCWLGTNLTRSLTWSEHWQGTKSARCSGSPWTDGINCNNFFFFFGYCYNVYFIMLSSDFISHFWSEWWWLLEQETLTQLFNYHTHFEST